MPSLVNLSTRDRIVFSDLNLTYDTQRQDPNDVVINESSLNNAIITILGTRKGSRVFRGNFGSNLIDLLFDPMDEMTVRHIETELLKAITDYEFRVVLTGVTVLPDYDNQQYFVELEYVIPQLNNKQVSFNFNLDQRN